MKTAIDFPHPAYDPPHRWREIIICHPFSKQFLNFLILLKLNNIYDLTLVHFKNYVYCLEPPREEQFINQSNNDDNNNEEEIGSLGAIPNHLKKHRSNIQINTSVISHLQKSALLDTAYPRYSGRTQ